MNSSMVILIPVMLYLAFMLGLAYYISKKGDTGEEGYLSTYFIGDRKLGGFVLAMTLIATYTSASSFVGGPGSAYYNGLSWVLLSMIQVPTAFLTLGVLGKKFAIISRKIDGVTITDYFKRRYESDSVVILCSLALVLFMVAMMVAQFIGGARLFQGLTGISYEMGLTIFGLTVIVYTTIGGFKAVAITDAIQGVIMIIVTTLIIGALIAAGGGTENITQTLLTQSPDMLMPETEVVTKPFILSFWVVVGFAVLGIPQTAARCMSFKDSKALHNAMIIGTFVVGFILLGMHLAGVYAAAVFPGIEDADLVIPVVMTELFNPVVAGILIGGPLAAVMSTVDSLLLVASAAIIKDLYVNYASKERIEKTNFKKMSFGITAILGLLVFVFALSPPDFLITINIFAMGGLQTVFLWPIILGLYWKRANAPAVIASAIVGVVLYIPMKYLGIRVGGFDPIVLTLAVNLVIFIVVAYMTKKPSKEVEDLFFKY